MLIYNVTAHVEFKIEKEWLLWMKQKHLSEILATKKFSEAKIFKIISEQDQGGASYAVQYHCKNKDLLNDFFKDYANYFQKKWKRNLEIVFYFLKLNFNL